MAEEDWPPAVDPYQVAEIVSSYVRHHKIEPDQLARLVIEVYRALTSLEQATPAQEPPRVGGADPTLGAAGLCGLP